MPTNTSKALQPRFWKIWSQSGSVVPDSSSLQGNTYIHQFVTIPPPTAEVTRMIGRITRLLNTLEVKVKGLLSSLGEDTCLLKRREGLSELLEEVGDARYQANNCEYFSAKEYLGFVLPQADLGIKWKILKISKLLDWCIENDHRSTYTWVPVSK